MKKILLFIFCLLLAGGLVAFTRSSPAADIGIQCWTATPSPTRILPSPSATPSDRICRTIPLPDGRVQQICHKVHRPAHVKMTPLPPPHSPRFPRNGP